MPKRVEAEICGLFGVHGVVQKKLVNNSDIILHHLLSVSVLKLI
jgi:hypothetical protein